MNKKVRLLTDIIPNNWNCKDGPGIASANELYYLKDEPWLEIKNTSIKQCKEDGVIPWVMTGCRPELQQCEDLGIQMIIGPHAVFGCSDHPEYNDKELSSPAIHRLLMVDDTNITLAKKHCTYSHDRIRRVKFMMRPELYSEPYYYKHEWDVYFHIKTDINRLLTFEFPNCTATNHGWYTFKELKYKAQHSAVCVHGCYYDNYGIAIHEISLLGCPIVYDGFGMKGGTVTNGMGVKVNDIGNDDIKVLTEAVYKAMSMNRKEVWETSKEFQSPENCLKTWRNAICQ